MLALRVSLSTVATIIAPTGATMHVFKQLFMPWNKLVFIQLDHQHGGDTTLSRPSSLDSL